MRLVSECRDEFDASLENDFNTSHATNSFFKLVKGINRIAASESMTKIVADLAMPEFERMLGVLGLRVQKVTEGERQSITDLIKKRDELRAQKQYKEADQIRDKISQMNIVLLDHKGKTIWMKKEKIKSDP